VRPPISQALAGQAAKRITAPLTIIATEAFAVAVAEIELGNVAVKVLLRAMLIDTLHAAFEDRKELLDRVRVNAAKGYIPPSFTLCLPAAGILANVPDCTRRGRVGTMLIGIAGAMFVALFGWGSNYFGWSDPDGKAQLALVTCFILGATCGYKTKS